MNVFDPAAMRLFAPPHLDEAVIVLGVLAAALGLAVSLAYGLRARAPVDPAGRVGGGGLQRRFRSLGILALALGIAVTAGGWVFLGFLALCTGIAVAELVAVAGTRGSAGLALAAALPVLAVPLGPVATLVAMSLAVLPSAVTVLRPPYDAVAVGTAGALTAGLVLVAIPAVLLGLLRQQPDGYVLTALLILVPQVADGYALLTGRWLGRHRLAPGLSPGKTVEGVAGGLVAGIAVAVVLSHRLAGIGTGAAILLGALLVCAGVVGDLMASMIKRSVGVDDFGRVLPGHGGLLDRLDSLMFAVPLGLLVHALLVTP